MNETYKQIIDELHALGISSDINATSGYFEMEDLVLLFEADGFTFIGKEGNYYSTDEILAAFKKIKGYDWKPRPAIPKIVPWQRKENLDCPDETS